MLFDYTAHIKDMARNRRLRTLLPHFYDLVHIDTAEGRNIRLVVMNNLRPSGMSVHETYGEFTAAFAPDMVSVAHSRYTLIPCAPNTVSVAHSQLLPAAPRSQGKHGQPVGERAGEGELVVRAQGPRF